MKFAQLLRSSSRLLRVSIGRARAACVFIASFDFAMFSPLVTKHLADGSRSSRRVRALDSLLPPRGFLGQGGVFRSTPVKDDALPPFFSAN